jgi:N-acetylglutamate synthase-like GNAT family acetyltransferase
MSEAYQIRLVEKPDEAASKIIWAGIQKHMNAQASDPEFQQICFALYSEDDEIVGGVIGDKYWDWIYIDMLWVKEKLRGCGYGRQLMTHLEKEAVSRGVSHIYLNPFSFQSPGFYQKCGFKMFGKLENFPTGHQRHFFTKQLKRKKQKKDLKNGAANEIYQIRVRTHLDQRWSDWFDGFQIEYQNGYSIITGAVPDQSALHGVFAKIRDLGLEIMLVEKVERLD